MIVLNTVPAENSCACVLWSSKWAELSLELEGTGLAWKLRNLDLLYAFTDHGTFRISGEFF